jgi:hypothetical protein
MPENLGGADALADMDRNIDKLAGPALKLSLKIPLVVYSGLESTEISVPQSRNFQLLEILKKGVSLEELKQSMKQVLTKLPHFDVGTPVGLQQTPLGG